MAPPKLYAARERRHCFLTPEIARVVGTGPNRQGEFRVAAHTKAEALARLRELGMPMSTVTLVVVEVHSRDARLWSVLSVPGDLVAWVGRIVDAPIALVRAGQTTPTVAAHWRREPGVRGLDMVARTVEEETPEITESEPGEHDVRVFNDHSNDLGDWCPHSGAVAPADAEDDDSCPAGCRGSYVTEDEG